MSVRDKLSAALDNTGSDSRESAPTEAWRPRLELDPTGGFFVTQPHPASQVPDQESLLREFDLDPDKWQVTNVRKSRWQKHNGDWLEAYRVSVVPYETSGEVDNDFRELVRHIEKWKPSKVTPFTGEGAFVLCVGDTQYGKDANGGTAAIVDRMLTGIDAGVARYKELNKLGRNLGTVVLPQLGDCIEGTVSQGGKVLGRLDLGVTAQVRIGRRVLLAQIKAFAPLCERLIVPVVPGNHDEPHRAVLTDPTDSWQIEIASAVQDAIAMNPEFDHVEFRYPEQDGQTLAIEVCGTMLGFAHGHQSRDAAKWWQGQATGRTPVGDADVLVTGHFHHFRAQQVGPRLWIQVPAMDGGSPWFRDKTGLESPTGLVSFVVGEGRDPRSDMAVLAGEWR